MQNKINEYKFDKELCISDSFGKSVILCSPEIAQELLNINSAFTNQYKGHDIYIKKNMNRYKIFPLKLNLKGFLKLEECTNAE